MHRFGRDPFARTERTREVVEVGISASCAWCGAVRVSGRRRIDRDAIARDARRTLYRYGVESDGGRRGAGARLFCSASCHKSFHG